MNILFLAPRFPYPLDKGDKLTIFNYLKYFNGNGHKITLLVFYEDKAELEYLDKIKPHCDKILTVHLKKSIAVFNVLKNFFAGIPFQISYYQNGNFKKILKKLLKEESFDLLYAHTIRMGGYIRKIHSLPKVCAMQISMTLNYRRLKENSSNPVQKLFYYLEYILVKNFEYNLTNDFDQCMLISEFDKREIEKDKAALKNIFYNPHGVDYKYFTYENGVDKEPNSLIMTGNFGYFPNTDAILYFYNEIYPLIKEKIPEVKVYIVGKNPPANLKKLEDKNIIVTDMVPDLRPYLSKSCVSIDPLRIGAGLQNKVIEAMSMSLPVVATSIANEGIKAKNGEEIFLADTAKDFADKVIMLLQNDSLRSETGKKAREFILRQYTWEYFLTQLEDSFTNLVKDHVAK